MKNLPQTIQEVKQYYEDYQQMKQQQQKEKTEEGHEVAPIGKRPKVKKPQVEFPVYESTWENVSLQSYNQVTPGSDSR